MKTPLISSQPTHPASICDSPKMAAVEDLWWDKSGFWFGLHTLYDPVRIPYFRAALAGLKDRNKHPRLLDVGSGAGFAAAGLSDTAETMVLDRSFDPVSQAGPSGARFAVVADAEHLPVIDGHFDAVVASEMLEHVDHPARVVEEAARVTKLGGLLLFSTPTRTLWSRLFLISAAQRWSLTRTLPHDLHNWDSFLTAAEMTGLLDRYGFQLLHISGIGMSPAAVPGAVRALWSLKTGRIAFGEAGERIRLSLTRSTRLAMIGVARRVEGPSIHRLEPTHAE